MHSGQKDNKRECQPAFTQKKMRGDVTVKIELGSGDSQRRGRAYLRNHSQWEPSRKLKNDTFNKGIIAKICKERI